MLDNFIESCQIIVKPYVHYFIQEFAVVILASQDSPETQFFSLAEAAKLMPGHPHISTLHRWRISGVRGVRLDTTLIGGRRFVTRESIAEFFQKINQSASDSSSPQQSLSGNLKTAESFLDREGV